MWNGSIFVGALVGERISRLEMDETYRSAICEE
jgi:hypothetical protein